MAIRPKFDLKGLGLLLAVLGPGIITAMVDNDAGGIATYSVAGAQFGYTMLWSLIPVTLFLIVVQEMCARMGAVTGKGLADLIRENFGVKITVFIMFGMLFANFFVTVAEFAGIAASGSLFGLDKYVLIPITAVFVLLATIRLNYRYLEKFFLLLTLFYISYILSGFMANPDWSVVAKHMVTVPANITSAYLVLLIGLIGTTITPWMQFYLQSSVVEKGIKAQDYKYSRWEVILGCIATDVITFFVIVTCATVLFPNNVVINDAADAAKALAPLAGQYASMLFAIGLFGASLFGAFVLPISTSYYICEAFGWESGINKKFDEAKNFYLILILMTLLAAAIILIPSMPLIQLMLAAQVINGAILPLTLIPVMILVNKKRIMGQYTNSKIANVFSWICVTLIIMTTIAMIISMFM